MFFATERSWPLSPYPPLPSIVSIEQLHVKAGISVMSPQKLLKRHSMRLYWWTIKPCESEENLISTMQPTYFLWSLRNTEIHACYVTKTLTAKGRISTPATPRAGLCFFTHPFIPGVTGVGSNTANSITIGEAHSAIAKDQWRTFCMRMCVRIGWKELQVHSSSSYCTSLVVS